MNLKEYYINNVNKNSYYFKFKDYIISFDDDYEVFNETTAIEEFKEIIQPINEYGDILNYRFILLSFFLNSKGYVIEQFPNQLKYPVDITEFAYGKIRNRIGGDRVAWCDRRQLISELNFNKNSTILENEEIEEIISKITTSDYEFKNMPIDNKLENITNAIEYLLKENDKFDIIPSGYFFDLLDNEKIKEYRRLIHCFRHASKDSIVERNAYTDKQKQFLANIGIVILIEINNYRKEN